MPGDKKPFNVLHLDITLESRRRPTQRIDVTSKPPGGTRSLAAKKEPRGRGDLLAGLVVRTQDAHLLTRDQSAREHTAERVEPLLFVGEGHIRYVQHQGT